MLSVAELTGSGKTETRDAWLYLEEMTHRALNDYTAMLTMVRRAADRAPDGTSAAVLNEVGVRLRASAMTYLALRPPLDGSDRDLSQELAVLCTSISNSVLSPRGITLTLSADPVIVSPLRCWQISLVVSELLNNAAKHAFRQRDAGAVTIKISTRGGMLRCAIMDDGGVDSVPSFGRGTAIVNALVDGLGGTVSREYRSSGSTIAFCVPLTDADCVDQIATRMSPAVESRAFDSL
jgi:two-component sensor histidine kinase